jgi:hypothetical protein
MAADFFARGFTQSSLGAEHKAQTFGQSVQDVGSRRSFAGEELVGHQRSHSGFGRQVGQRQVAGVDGPPQLAAERRLSAGFLAHLIASRQVG